MGMRKYRRQVAKDRMRALGIDRVNRRFGRVQDGLSNWRRALTGETGEAAEKAQMKVGNALQAARRDCAGNTHGYIKKRA